MGLGGGLGRYLTGSAGLKSIIPFRTRRAKTVLTPRKYELTVCGDKSRSFSCCCHSWTSRGVRDPDVDVSFESNQAFDGSFHPVDGISGYIPYSMFVFNSKCH